VTNTTLLILMVTYSIPMMTEEAMMKWPSDMKADNGMAVKTDHVNDVMAVIVAVMVLFNENGGNGNVMMMIMILLAWYYSINDSDDIGSSQWCGNDEEKQRQ